ncbi:MAG: HAD-IA family hydrolase [Fidelibacterota bacterium]|nr:MAG: HAD-IA family hydrolase [Candidatus Neomarinimicrobiota bacterium]
MSYDAVIFDVDGVLMDTRHSFTVAVLDAVATATGSGRFTIGEVRQLKAIPGFNNDWHVAVAGAAWVSFCGELSFSEFTQRIDGHGGGLPGLKKVVGKSLTTGFEARVIRLAQEAYGGTTACRQLYGFEPQTIRQAGRWRAERPLLSPDRAAGFISRMGIVTGRDAAEMELAFRRLGWRLPPEQLAVSRDMSLDKPNPAPLLAILAHLASEEALYAGDSRDDLELVRNAREAGARVDFCFIGAPPAPWSEVELAFNSVNDLLDSIEVLHDEE